MPPEPEVLIRRGTRAAAVVSAIVLPLAVGCGAWLETRAWLTSALMGAATLVAIIAWVAPWRIAFDAEGIATGGFLPRRVRWREIDRIVVRATTFGRLVVIVPRSKWQRTVRIHFMHWGPALLRALRSRATPGTYRLTHADEEALWGTALQAKIRRQTEVRAARKAAYREAAGVGATLALLCPLPSEVRHRIRAGAWTGGVLVSLAIAHEVSRPLWFFAVAGAIGSAVAATRSWRFARWYATVRGDLRAWLGDTVLVDARGMLTSVDGLRRFRQLASDLDDPWRGLHAHYDEISPDGTTIWSEPQLVPDFGLPAEMRPPTARELARVLEVRSERDLAYVVLDHGPDGALVYGFDDRGRAIGDTFHEDASAARAQVAREATIDRWRELDPRDDPWSLARIAAQHEEGEASDASTPAEVTRSTGTPP